MDRLMQTTFPFPTHPLSEIGDAPWAPLADVEDTGDAYVMELELPGVEKDHISRSASPRRPRRRPAASRSRADRPGAA
ncbi:HSP20 family molecular chaperone IbpA [Streptomyces albogriseolus]